MLQSWTDHKNLLDAEEVQDPVLLEEANLIIKNIKELQAELAIVIAAEQRRIDVEESDLE